MVHAAIDFDRNCVKIIGPHPNGNRRGFSTAICDAYPSTDLFPFQRLLRLPTMTSGARIGVFLSPFTDALFQIAECQTAK